MKTSFFERMFHMIPKEGSVFIDSFPSKRIFVRLESFLEKCLDTYVFDCQVAVWVESKKKYDYFAHVNIPIVCSFHWFAARQNTNWMQLTFTPYDFQGTCTRKHFEEYATYDVKNVDKA